MPVTHDLIQDLPEFRERLQGAQSDPQLLRLLEEYRQLDRQTLELEEQQGNSASEELNQSRKARLLVKDRIEQHLRYGT